jgi:hypothetical protein
MALKKSEPYSSLWQSCDEPSRCKCGCQLASDPWVWIDETMATARSFSSTVARMNEVTVRAATRESSPRSFRS